MTNNNERDRIVTDLVDRINAMPDSELTDIERSLRNAWTSTNDTEES